MSRRVLYLIICIVERRGVNEGAMFKPFNPSSEEIKKEIEKLEKYPDVSKALKLINQVLSGKRYLQMYDQFFISFCALSGYLLWILLCFSKLFSSAIKESSNQSNALVLKSGFISALIVVYSWLYRRQVPIQYFAYSFFPIYFAYLWIKESRGQVSIFNIRKKDLREVVQFLMMAARLPMAFFNRRYIALEFTLKAIKQAVQGNDFAYLKSAVAAALAIFGLVPPIKTPNRIVTAAGSLAAFMFSSYGYSRYSSKNRWLKGQIVLNIATSGLVAYIDWRLAGKLALNNTAKLLAWSVFIFSVVSISLGQIHRNNHCLLRLLAVFVPMTAIMILLSVSYEIYFFTIFAFHLSFWLHSGGEETDNEADMAREFLMNIICSFFGTGNIASISSFSLPSVYRLITRFNPFLMAILLITKLMIPFFSVGAVAWSKLLKNQSLDPKKFFLLAMAQAELANIVFFFKVTDNGSWLEIGESISRFILSNCFLIIMLGLLGIGKFIVGSSVTFETSKNNPKPNDWNNQTSVST